VSYAVHWVVHLQCMARTIDRIPPSRSRIQQQPAATTAPRIRGNGEVLRSEEFTQRKEAAEAARLARLSKQPRHLAGEGRDLGGYPLLQARAASKTMACMHARWCPAMQCHGAEPVCRVCREHAAARVSVQ
jgi:hypothetical protein